MKRIYRIVFFILLSVQLSNGQFKFSDGSANHIVSFGFTSDAFTSIEMGYRQNLCILHEKDLQIYACFSIPLLLSVKGKSLKGWEQKIGVNGELFKMDRIKVVGDIQFFQMYHHQVLGTFIPLGYNMRLTPAYQFSNGYWGFQINWNQIIATHIYHSEYLKNTFSNLNVAGKNLIAAQPKGGWYSSTGSHFGFGIENSWKIGGGFILYDDLGIIKFSSLYTGMFDAMMMGQVPLYASLRLYYTM